MRILYSHRIQSRDGQSVHVEELVAAFRSLGHEVLVVGPGLYEHARFGGESRLVPWIRARLPAVIGEVAELIYNVPAWWRLRAAFRRFRPDLIYERYNLYYLAGTWVARGNGTKLFLEVNSPLVEERTRFGQLRLRWLAGALERYVWRSASKVLVVTGVLQQTVAAAGVPPERLAVVPNGIDPSLFAALPAREAGPGPLVLGFVGFVRDWHGLDAVIAAMAAEPGEPDLRLVVVGDGPARAALEQQAASLGVSDRTTFTGLQPREAIPQPGSRLRYRTATAGRQLRLAPENLRIHGGRTSDRRTRSAEHPRGAARRRDCGTVRPLGAWGDVARHPSPHHRRGIAVAVGRSGTGRDCPPRLHMAGQRDAGRGLGTRGR